MSTKPSRSRAAHKQSSSNGLPTVITHRCTPTQTSRANDILRNGFASTLQNLMADAVDIANTSPALQSQNPGNYTWMFTNDFQSIRGYLRGVGAPAGAAAPVSSSGD